MVRSEEISSTLSKMLYSEMGPVVLSWGNTFIVFSPVGKKIFSKRSHSSEKYCHDLLHRSLYIKPAIPGIIRVILATKDCIAFVYIFWGKKIKIVSNTLCNFTKVV